ncbi:glycosyltransferase [Haliea salexigens]|uniref:glycosyltransferase n=1 Tax=Haliea salexigens TaxID=287487 RepID=UPI000410E5C3|nr:glycosyltransferase [Haliea salexigens]
MLARFLKKDDRSARGKDVLTVSFVVIVYDMPLQAENTVRSLLPGYQLGVSGDEYEVIVVENASANTMRPEFLQGLPASVRYFLRENPESSPARAINFGAEQARGENICVIIDGARMLTPGVVRTILMGHRLSSSAVVAIPGYHLGRELQQEAVNSGYSLEQERTLLSSIAWPEAGYRLFDIACFSGSSAPGLFMPNSESNCISIPREIWQGLGGYDERFNLRGGGLINLDLYKRVCEYPGVQHIIALGEGTFHQFHGGVTTGGQSREKREAYIEQSKAQYRELRGEEFVSPVSQPLYLGEIPEQAQKFVHYSATRVLMARGEAPLTHGPA